MYIETTGYYFPDINIRLLSVQRFIDEHPGEQCSLSLCDKGMIFTFPSPCGGGKLTFQYKHTNHLYIYIYIYIYKLEKQALDDIGFIWEGVKSKSRLDLITRVVAKTYTSFSF